jgi:hypothetical protein
MGAISASHSRAADFDQRIERGLEIERRTTDHLEHIGVGGLLLQRFAQLVEQTGILDGELAGEAPSWVRSSSHDNRGCGFARPGTARQLARIVQQSDLLCSASAVVNIFWIIITGIAGFVARLLAPLADRHCSSLHTSRIAIGWNLGSGRKLDVHA